MGKLKEAILLADADVLIDYVEASPEILTITSRTLAPVYVLRQVLDEARPLTPARAKRLGLKVVDPPAENLIEAGAERGGPLSFPDRLCLVCCRRESWTCLTNDQALIRRCKSEKVATKRGLRLLLDLVEAAELQAKRAERIAEKIATNNPHHITNEVLAEFRRLLRTL